MVNSQFNRPFGVYSSRVDIKQPTKIQGILPGLILIPGLLIKYQGMVADINNYQQTSRYSQGLLIPGGILLRSHPGIHSCCLLTGKRSLLGNAAGFFIHSSPPWSRFCVTAPLKPGLSQWEIMEKAWGNHGEIMENHGKSW